VGEPLLALCTFAGGSTAQAKGIYAVVRWIEHWWIAEDQRRQAGTVSGAGLADEYAEEHPAACEEAAKAILNELIV